ncbi:MAG: DNA repair protein RecN, partial [Sulfobacillus sp.]
HEGMEGTATEGTQVEERLLLIEDLKRKYGDDVTAVSAYAETAEAELQRLADAETELRRLEAETTALGREADELDRIVWAGRKRAASRLSAEVEAELRFLGFSAANFRVDVAEETVSFWFQPNPGEQAQPVAAIASGGEQSRLLLALRQVAKANERRVLLLDEVDQGLGGDSAQAVAKRLRELAALGQVVAVTHQAVVAAHADHHLAVSKEVSAGRTLGVVRHLSHEDRVHEVARMLAGTRQGLGQDHARELLRLSRGE